MKRLIIVDDHEVVRHGLKNACQVHGLEVVAAVGNVNQARSAIAALVPDAVVVDLNLPDSSGFDLIHWIRQIDNKLPIIILTLNDSVEHLIAARKSGANAYVVKSAPIEEIVAAINFAIKSPQSFSSKIRESSYESTLTAREIDVLFLIEKGLSNVEISQKLHISVSTVKTHISSIFQKLSAKNRVAAISVAREAGLLL
jgi:DNA-binding NarL/FixJ family response regulator